MGRHPGTPPHTAAQTPGPGAAEGPWGPPTCAEQRSHATLRPPSGQSRRLRSECPAEGRGGDGGRLGPVPKAQWSQQDPGDEQGGGLGLTPAPGEEGAAVLRGGRQA